MRPTLEPGEWAIAVRARRLHRGDVVVVEHPDRVGFELVKRVAHLPGDVAPDGLGLVDRVWVEGDDPEGSSDSRSFGPLPMGLVRGRVWFVWWPPRRIRALASGEAVAIFPISSIAFAVAMIRTRCRGLVGAMIPDRCCCPRVPRGRR